MRREGWSGPQKTQKRYGFFRHDVKQVIYRYLDCGVLHNGFARAGCGDCGHGYLLAFVGAKQKSRFSSGISVDISVHFAIKRGGGIRRIAL